MTNKSLKGRKVAIITILDNQNIGTYLQAFALKQVVEKRSGAQVSIINYKRKVTSTGTIVKGIIKKNANPIFGLVSVIYRLIVLTIAKKKLISFLKSQAHLTNRYSSINELKQNPPKADIYLTGSDQVWNSKYNKGIDEAFYLNFAPEDKPRYAYAASIGMNEFPANELERTKKLLNKYSKISVREDSAVKLLNDIGINTVDHVLDPTLLLNKEDWIQIAKKDSFKKAEPYLLIYSVEKKRKHVISEVAKQIAKQKKLKIYVVTPEWFREKFECDRVFYFSTPERFLNLFIQADFTVVSSFHGTAFSVNLNKQFISISPENFNSRANSLLQRLLIKDRLVTNVEEAYSISLMQINYNPINKLLSRYREESFEFIRKIS